MGCVAETEFLVSGCVPLLCTPEPWPVYKSQGISATALKKACRELGVERWPRRKRQADGAGGSSDDKRRSYASTSGNSPVPSVASNSAASPSDEDGKGEMAPPADLMDMLHRNAILVLQAAKKLDGAQAEDLLDSKMQK